MYDVVHKCHASEFELFFIMDNTLSDTDRYQETMFKYLRNEYFTDVTLVSDDFQKFAAHKILLSAASPVLESLLLIDPEMQSSHTILPLRGYEGHEVQSLLKFIYAQNVTQEMTMDLGLQKLLTELKVRGWNCNKVNLNEKQENSDKDTVDKMKEEFRVLNSNNITMKVTVAKKNSIVGQGTSISEMKKYGTRSKQNILQKPIIISSNYPKEKVLEDSSKTKDPLEAKRIMSCSVIKRNIIPKGQEHGKVDYDNSEAKPEDEIVQQPQKQQHKCDKCDQFYPTKTNLEIHKKCVHDLVRYPCSKCPFQASSTSYLYLHEAGFHQGITHNCKLCEYKGKSVSILKRHIKVIHEGLRFYCDECPEKFTASGQLKRHQYKKHGRDQLRFKNKAIYK